MSRRKNEPKRVAVAAPGIGDGVGGMYARGGFLRDGGRWRVDGTCGRYTEDQIAYIGWRFWFNENEVPKSIKDLLQTKFPNLHEYRNKRNVEYIVHKYAGTHKVDVSISFYYTMYDLEMGIDKRFCDGVVYANVKKLLEAHPELENKRLWIIFHSHE